MDSLLFFAILPYVAMVIFFVVTIQRYRQRKFSYSSLSSQFLENQMHFWGSVPFHYGILFVITGHFVGFLFPGLLLAWNESPTRLYLLEITALAFAILALVGLINVMVRRWTYPKIRKVTNVEDWIVYALLLIQIGTGIAMAVTYGWGSSWYATSMVPWLWSLITLSPDVTYVASMPLLVHIHVINAFVLIAFFPFTRLVLVRVVPNQYLWRKTQVVIWNRERVPESRDA